MSKIKSFYDPGFGPFNWYDDEVPQHLLDWAMDDKMLEPVPEDTAPFRVGQVYERQPAVRQRCAGCGGERFELAQGDYFTAVRCPACGWEACIHEG